jgi:hypothetical protein
MEMESQPGDDIIDTLLQEPNTIFNDPNRIALLEKLESQFQTLLPPELWSVLWMADIEKLAGLVDKASDPDREYVYLTTILKEAKIIQHCTSLVYMGIDIDISLLKYL